MRVDSYFYAHTGDFESVCHNSGSRKSGGFCRLTVPASRNDPCGAQRDRRLSQQERSGQGKSLEVPKSPRVETFRAFVMHPSANDCSDIVLFVIVPVIDRGCVFFKCSSSIISLD